MLEKYAKQHPDLQFFIITSPLGERYTYQYEENALIVLVPNHKLIFINLIDKSDAFEDYVDDVIQDLNSISDKYKYMDHIGRARTWKKKSLRQFGMMQIHLMWIGCYPKRFFMEN